LNFANRPGFQPTDLAIDPSQPERQAFQNLVGADLPNFIGNAGDSINSNILSGFMTPEQQQAQQAFGSTISQNPFQLRPEQQQQLQFLLGDSSNAVNSAGVGAGAFGKGRGESSALEQLRGRERGRIGGQFINDATRQNVGFNQTGATGLGQLGANRSGALNTLLSQLPGLSGAGADESTRADLLSAFAGGQLRGFDQQNLDEQNQLGVMRDQNQLNRYNMAFPTVGGAANLSGRFGESTTDAPDTTTPNPFLGIAGSVLGSFAGPLGAGIGKGIGNAASNFFTPTA